MKNSVLYWHLKKWQVHALTVMPDHVHILTTTLRTGADEWFSLTDILRSIKRHTARSVNSMRGRSGPLWEIESFDRIVRDRQEFLEKATYILNNAVRAGLADDGRDYDGFWCEQC